VRFLASEAGIGQFLDIGTGIPAAGSTHEVAQEAAPGSRVVYDPYQIVTRLMDAVPAGSYLAISHGASDITPERMAELAERINQVSYQQFSSRSRAEVEGSFAGLELVEPGVVQVQEWRPGIMPPGAMPVWAAVARKG
jgi:hypothetical protein